jgi:hypothetical protein
MSKLIRYTEEFHAQRLLEMLEKRDPCACCPKVDNFYYENGVNMKYSNNACKICLNFISLSLGLCPCHRLEDQEAIKRTWLALEEKGYI